MSTGNSDGAAVASPVPVTCAFCDGVGGALLWEETDWRVVRPDDALFPWTWRVVCQHHVAELSALPDAALHRGIALAVTIERTLLRDARPDKINVASLGNQTPHVHWHVIARHADDTHFPDSVWSAPRRPADEHRLAERRAALPALDAAIGRALGDLPPCVDPLSVTLGE